MDMTSVAENPAFKVIGIQNFEILKVRLRFGDATL